MLTVLGFHRSGTSALSGALYHLGVPMGDDKDFHPSSAHNQRGYFERKDVIALNDLLLSACGGSWHNPPPHHVIAMRSGRYIEKTRETIVGLGAIKDPRLILTWPLWEKAIDDCKVLISLRPQEQSCASLMKRDGFTKDKAYRLWQEYMDRLQPIIKGNKCIVVKYDSLVDTPVQCIDQLICGLELSPTEEQRESAIQFITPDLRHNE